MIMKIIIIKMIVITIKVIMIEIEIVTNLLRLRWWENIYNYNDSYSVCHNMKFLWKIFVALIIFILCCIKERVVAAAIYVNLCAIYS